MKIVNGEIRMSREEFEDGINKTVEGVPFILIDGEDGQRIWKKVWIEEEI